MLGVDTPTCVPKIRKRTGEVEKKYALHEEDIVNGKTAVIIDDIIGSGATLVQACQGLRDNGAEEVVVYATHAVLNYPAEENLRKIKARVYTTDTVYHSPEKLKELGITTFPISSIIAEAIKRQHIGESTRELREQGATEIISRGRPRIRDLFNH
jgi:phosphoribosylpyrophosphate synthetase